MIKIFILVVSKNTLKGVLNNIILGFKVGRKGFEPLTICLKGNCSTRLS